MKTIEYCGHTSSSNIHINYMVIGCQWIIYRLDILQTISDFWIRWGKFIISESESESSHLNQNMKFKVHIQIKI